VGFQGTDGTSAEYWIVRPDGAVLADRLRFVDMGGGKSWVFMSDRLVARSVRSLHQWQHEVSVHSAACASRCDFVLPLVCFALAADSDAFCQLNRLGGFLVTPRRSMDMIKLAGMRMTRAAWLRTCAMACRAVESLHTAGLFHGDVTVENLLVDGVVRDPASGVVIHVDRVEVMDMESGQVVGRDGTLAVSTTLSGKEHSLPPEWLRGDCGRKMQSDASCASGFAADVFTLGCSLLTLRVGRHGHGMRDVRRFVNEAGGDVRSLLSLRGEAVAATAAAGLHDADLSTLQRMLEVSPSKRCSASEAAKAFEEELRRCGGGEARRCGCGRHA